MILIYYSRDECLSLTNDNHFLLVDVCRYCDEHHKTLIRNVNEFIMFISIDGWRLFSYNNECIASIDWWLFFLSIWLLLNHISLIHSNCHHRHPQFIYILHTSKLYSLSMRITFNVKINYIYHCNMYTVILNSILFACADFIIPLVHFFKTLSFDDFGFLFFFF